MCSSSWARNVLCRTKMGTEALGCCEGGQLERRLLLPHLTPWSFLAPAVFPVFLGQWLVPVRKEAVGHGSWVPQGACMCLRLWALVLFHVKSASQAAMHFSVEIYGTWRESFSESGVCMHVLPKIKGALLMDRRKYCIRSRYWNHFECSALVVMISGKISMFS